MKRQELITRIAEKLGVDRELVRSRVNILAEVDHINGTVPKGKPQRSGVARIYDGPLSFYVFVICALMETNVFQIRELVRQLPRSSNVLMNSSSVDLNAGAGATVTINLKTLRTQWEK